MRRVPLGVLGSAARSDGALAAEVLVFRHQKAVLRRQITRARYEPADRAWFAALTALIPRARWADVFPVTPATLLTWHRTLVNRKFSSTRRPRGRPKTTASTRALILRMAREDPAWVHRRIQGELMELGFQIAHSTVWEILHKASIDPAPRRNQTHLRTVLAEYVAHYNSARPHQGIAQRVPEGDLEQPAAQVIDLNTARIRRRPVLGGITSEYHIAA